MGGGDFSLRTGGHDGCLLLLKAQFCDKNTHSRILIIVSWKSSVSPTIYWLGFVINKTLGLFKGL